MSNTGTVFAGDINTMTITSAIYAGGIIGDSFSGATWNGSMTNAGNVTGEQYVGGLFGDAGNGIFQGSGGLTATAGTISGTFDVGGLFGGLLDGSGSLVFSPTGTVSTSNAVTVIGNVPGGGSGNIGGLFGVAIPATFAPTLGLVNNATVTADNGSTNVGGIAGDFIAGNTVSVSFTNNAPITGSNAVGGIFGALVNTATSSTMTNNSSGIINVYNNGNSVNLVGGIVGNLEGNNQSGTWTNNAAINVYNGSSDNTLAIGGVIGIAQFDFGQVTLAGHYTNNGPITSVGGNANIGGVVGELIGTTVTGSMLNSSTGIVTGGDTVTGGSNDVGGVIGGSPDPNVSRFPSTFTSTAALENDAAVNGIGSFDVGGIFGFMGHSTTFAGTMTSKGNVEGLTNVGGAVGELAGGSTLGGTINVSLNTLTLESGGQAWEVLLVLRMGPIASAPP